MGLRQPSKNSVDVDMVPLIDIISLLLMFLIIVGDLTRSSQSIQMQLPRADQSRKSIAGPGRLVVQLAERDRRYFAVVENRWYELIADGRSRSLRDYLQTHISNHPEQVTDKGVATMRVKLRLPANTPMLQVEQVITTLANAGLVNIEYATEADQR